MCNFIQNQPLMKSFLPLLLFIVLSTPRLWAQEDEKHVDFEVEQETEYEGAFKHHQIGAMLGHIHISQGHNSKGKRWLVLPMISMNYNYKFNERWGIGLHTDLTLESYEVEENENEIVERKTPIAPAIMGIFKPGKHFTYMLGFGEEFAKEEDLFLIRAEIEYGLELPKEFEFGASVGWDFRFDAYDSWVLAVGVSKLF